MNDVCKRDPKQRTENFNRGRLEWYTWYALIVRFEVLVGTGTGVGKEMNGSGHFAVGLRATADVLV